jgi:ribonuclease P protein component
MEDFFCTEVAHPTPIARNVPLKREILRSSSVHRGLPIKMAPAGSFSFPKARRLTHRSEYERVKQKGLTQRGRLLMLNAMPVEDSGPWRAGFVTSGRLGGAVVRNRVRRRLREIVRRHQHGLRQGVWFVIIARHQAATARYDALEDEWLHLARRASILL